MMLSFHQYLARKYRRAVLLIACLAMMAAVPANADAFRVGMPEDFKPYTFAENGNWRGIDVDIGRHFYRALGIEPTFLPMPWARQLRLAEKGILDAILTVYCDERAPFLHVSSVFLYPVQISLFGRVEYAGDVAPEKEPFEGSTVGVVRANKLIHLLEQQDNVQIHESSSTPLLLEQLVADRIDFVLEEDLPFLSYAVDRGYQSAVREVRTLKEVRVCLAFSKNSTRQFDEAFLQRAEDTLKRMKVDGTIARIVAGYTK